MTLATLSHHEHAVRDANARYAVTQQRARVAEADARPRRWSLGSTPDGSAHLVVLIEGRECWYWTGDLDRALSDDRADAQHFATVAEASAVLNVIRSQENAS